MVRGQRSPVTPTLVGQIRHALEDVDEAGAALDAVLAGGAPLLARRQARAQLALTLESADRLLRRAADVARGHSYLEWSTWRHRLSQLDMLRQRRLLSDQDDMGVMPLGSIRAIDTGMSGPDIGDLQHGRSRAPGAPARYGLDMARVLAAPCGVAPAGPVDPAPAKAPVIALPAAGRDSSAAAA